MTIFRRTNSQNNEPGVISSSDESVTRLVRFAGRVLLWSCVLLLLIRGITSYLGEDSHRTPTKRGATVTVTQPTDTTPPDAQGK